MVSNIKKALLEFLQINDDEKVQMLMGPVMMLAPAFLVQVQGNLNFEFDDIDEVLEHPLAAPFLASFSQLAEGAIGDKNDHLKPIGELAIEKDHWMYARLSTGKLLINTFYDLLNDLDNSADSHVDVRGACPDLGVSGFATIKSEGIKDLLLMALMCNPGTQELRGKCQQ